MSRPRFTPWHMATLITGFLAVVAVAAVALLLGKDAVMALAAIIVLLVIGISWLAS